ncbi:MAG TPA: TIGR02587 family membrane protein [Gemmatimonadaceae bacterium]|nr:TIGR02587 family membrane protein [Gemmatimonadaceae bacterium]
MSSPSSPDEAAPPEGHRVRETAVSYARGVVGGLLVALPLLLTMEVWWGGFIIPAWRLLLLATLHYGVLLILQHYSGLHPSKTVAAQARAALVAYGIGIVVAAATLLALAVIRPGIAPRDLVGKLILEAIPVSIGSSVAMSEFGAEHEVVERRKEEESYWGMVGMALAGAMLLGFAVGVTEEPMMIGMHLTWVHATALVILSVLQVHLIVYAVEFRRHSRRGDRRWWQRLLKEGVSTYAVSLLVSAYVLWTFGRLGPDTGLVATVDEIITLGFAASLGAAAAELLI